MSEPLSIYRLAEELLHRGISATTIPGRIVLAGYAGHNWLFALDVLHVRKFHWLGGRIHIVASVEEALEKMGAG